MTVEFASGPTVTKSKSVERHIIHAVLSLDVGGLERIVLDLVRTGIKRGQRITVLCLERPGQLAAEVEAAGAHVVCLHKLPGIQKETTRKAREVLADLKPDVLHTHQIGALWYLGPAAKDLGIPVVHTEHIDNVGKAKGWLRKLKNRILWNRAARFASRFCCVSDDIARTARRWGTVPGRKLRVLLNGIDTERNSDRSARQRKRRELGLADDAAVIGCVGRLNEVKRQDLLVEAFAVLAKERPDLRLLLVGDGPERAALEEQVGRLGVADRVIFAGYQANPEEFLAVMDVFALTSRLEGLPLVMLEAWASGLPVVSSAVGGIPAVVEAGKTGLLFPSGDCEALVDCLRKVLQDQSLAAALGERGRREVGAKYSLERMAADYDREYELARSQTRNRLTALA